MGGGAVLLLTTNTNLKDLASEGPSFMMWHFCLFFKTLTCHLDNCFAYRNSCLTFMIKNCLIFRAQVQGLWFLRFKFRSSRSEMLEGGRLRS